MNEVPRPAPPQPHQDRWRQALQDKRAHAPTGGGLAGAVSGFLMSLGVLLLVVGGAVGWARWQGRSAVPLDDQLPYLLGVDADDTAANATTTATPAADPGAADAAASQAGSGGQNQAVADAGEQSVEIGVATGVTSETARTEGAASSNGGAGDLDRVVVVYVSGAVVTPGVVELAGGARVHHAVEAAGGPVASADLERVNLAARLMDGERIHVPAIGDDDAPEIVAPSRPIGTATPAGTGAAEAELLVDINRASVTELEQLPGIGPSIARSILELRTARGPYASVEELLLVDGIGPNKLETLRPHAVVGTG